MTIVGLIVAILLIVFALWIVSTYLPAPFKTPVLVIIVVLALLWVVMLLIPGARVPLGLRG